jgi:hypothetical protein
MAANEVTLARMDDQIDWYDKSASKNQKRYTRMKGAEIVAAAAIPVLAAVSAPPWGMGALGALVVIMEGFQHVHQFQHNWIGYRSTCESLKHEKYLYLANAGPYAAAGNADRLLAERVEALISQEHSKWVQVRKEEAEATEADT